MGGVLHGTWPTHEKASRYELGPFCGNTAQHLKSGRIMQAVGSPSAKSEGYGAGIGSLKWSGGFSEH